MNLHLKLQKKYQKVKKEGHQHLDTPLFYGITLIFSYLSPSRSSTNPLPWLGRGAPYI